MDTAIAELGRPLRWIAAGLEESGWAAELCDADWRLVWMSSQARELLGNPSDEEIGIGEHLLSSRMLAAWHEYVAPESRNDWMEQNLPQLLADTSPEELAAVKPELEPYLRELEPASIPVWTGEARFRSGRGQFMNARYFGSRLRTIGGEPIATVYLYGSPLPATLLALVSAGSRRMFERMARLTEPGRHEAALLFADLQASGSLSRRLPSAAYFELVRELTTAMDAVVIDHEGIVGKHAGDGLVAFFLVDDLRSPSAAALACLEAARGFAAAARETAAALDFVTPEDLRLNVGAHWGGTLYMGQVVTGGRLEVTALGDEVNECARLQQAARGGESLASKALVERLTTADAARLGIDPDRMTYTALAERPSVDGKIVRDAGTIAVTALPV